jgi:hypothetical protein
MLKESSGFAHIVRTNWSAQEFRLNTGGATDMDIADINSLIGRFGPTLVLHSAEKYLPDDPHRMLATGRTSVTWGLVENEDDYDAFNLEIHGSEPVSSDDGLLKAVAAANQDPKAHDPDFRCWLEIPDALAQGDYARARAQVVVTHQDPLQGAGRPLVQLQFWFFYGYNGPGKFHVRVGEIFSDNVEMDTTGRHPGDWEHVTLEVVPLGASDWQLRRVYLSRHDLTVWVSDLSSLEFDGEHPVIYAARDSHAHYPKVGQTSYKRVAHKDFVFGHLDVDLYDLTDNGLRFQSYLPDNFIVISDDFGQSVEPSPVWKTFAGRWGGYLPESYTYHFHVAGFDIPAYTYTEVGAGPHGPLQHGDPPGSDFGYPADPRGGIGIAVADRSRPYAFVRDTDGHIGCNWWDGSQWEWSDQGVPPGGVSPAGPVAVTSVDQHPYAFMTGTDGHLWVNWWDGKQWQWSDQGVPPGDGTVTGPVGVTLVDQRPYAFTAGTDGHLWLNWWNGSQWAWSDQGVPPGGGTVTGPVGVTLVDQRPYAFVIDTYGTMWSNLWSGSSWLWACQSARGGA